MPKNQVDRTIDRPYSTRTGGGAFSVVGGVVGGGGGGVGVTDHGLLSGLGDDDHAQYFNTTRGDARYPLLTNYNLHVGDPDAHHVRLHDILGASDHSITGGAALDVIGQSGAGVLARLTPSSNPGAASALLKSDASGFLTLAKLIAPTVATAAGNLSLAPASGYVTFPAAGVLNTASGGYTLAPATGITLDPAGDDVLLASATRIGTDNYASQATGWRVDYAGAADFRYLFVDEMHAKSFIADLEQALAGGQIIPKSVSLISRAFTLPAAGASGTLYVRDLPSAENMAVFESGDIVRLRQFSRSAGSLTIADAWGVVTAYSDLADKEQSWTFTRSSAPNAGTASGTIAVDSIVLDYGVSGNGLHEVNAIDGAYGLNSPYSQVVTWTTHPATGSSVRVRMGNLRGITGSTEYGLWAGKTTGANMLATGDKFAMRQGTTEVITFDNAGASYFAGVMTIGAAGEIRQGTGTAGTVGVWPSPGTAWGTYTGTRIGRDSGGIGRLGGFLSGATQWGADSNGRLMAGNNKVWLDKNGLGILTPSGSLDYTNAVTWWTAVDDTERAAIGAWTVTGGTEMAMRVGTAYASLDHNTRFNIRTGSSVGFSVLGATYANASGNFGVGLAYDTAPSAKLHVYGTTPVVRLASAASDQTIELNFYDADTTRKGRLLYAGANASPNKYFGFVNEASDGLWFLSDLTKWLSAAGSEFMRLNSDGLGVGAAAGTNERLRVAGGSAVTVLKLDSSHPSYGPALKIAATAGGGRTYTLQSTQDSNTGGEGLFQVVDATASEIRQTIYPLVTLANGSAMEFTANPGGLVIVTDETNGTTGIFLVRGADNQATVLVSEAPANIYAGGTTSTSGRISIFWNATKSNYVLHNQSGGERILSAIHVGVLN